MNKRRMDNPEMVDTENVSLFDMHEDMKTVDSISVGDLNDQVKDDRRKTHTKNTSSSERKFKS